MTRDGKDTADSLEKLMPVEVFMYATESEWREKNYNGRFKRHKTLVHAKLSARGCVGPVTLYEWVPAEYDFFAGSWQAIEFE